MRRMAPDEPLPQGPDAIHLLLAPLAADIPGRQFRAIVAFERSGEARVGARPLHAVSVTREGTVARRVVAAGSKSEREAVVLDTGDATLVLRRQGANPFETDPELDGLVGRRIRAEGSEHGQTLLVHRWDAL